MATTHVIYNKNSNSMSEMASSSVDLIVTSPPYPMIKMWDNVFSAQDELITLDLMNGRGQDAFLKMHYILNQVWDECDRVLKDGGFACINIGDAVRTVGKDFQMFSNHTQVINYFTSMGYQVLPDILWHKVSNAPNKFMGSGMYPAGAYVTYEHEYILIFRKGGKRTFTGKEKELRQKSAYFWEERNTWFSDIWELNGTSQQAKGMNNRQRTAAFPFELPYRLINMYSVEGDTVLDPFSGTGTTTLASAASNRNSIGYEIDKEYYNLAIENIFVTKNQLNNYIADRIKRHTSFIDSLNNEQKAKCYFNTIGQFKVKTKQETKIDLQKIDKLCRDGNRFVCIYKPIK